MILKYNKIQINCEKIHCLWLCPVAVIWFARIHCSRINTTIQGQGECLRSLNHSREYAVGSPLPCAGAVPALTWSDTFKSKL